MKNLIIKTMKKKGRVTTADIAGVSGCSRQYVQRFLKNLVDEGAIVRVGKSNQAHYILPPTNNISKTMPLKVHRIMTNRELSEDAVLHQIKTESAIFQDVPENVSFITDYAFTEMLNNAIEHSTSEKIDVVIMRTPSDIRFTVADRGIGVFNNIMKKKRLGATIAAIQDLIKGKETTAPEAHSGEGIFFTSKIADILTIKSFEKKLVFDNVGQDIYVRDVQLVKGTKVYFTLGLQSKKKLADLFSKYTDDSFQFSKTLVRVKLYHQDVDYVSRSQARRMLASLEKFKTVELDFKDVKTIGQAFADEIFRIWQANHKNVTFVVKEANENVMLMIRRAQSHS